MYYYTGRQDCVIYVGKDKEEKGYFDANYDELLIKHGWERDVWFHVDKLSSAHVYLRMPAGMDWQDIPEDIVEDCCQLTKANSIQGNKKDNIVVIYTPWENLKKDGSMAVGQVGFRKDRVVKRFKVHSRDNAIINRLNKTKVEKFPDLELEKLEYEKMLKRQYADEHRARQKGELEQSREYKKIAAQKDKGYLDLFDPEAVAHNSNQFRADDWEDDFM